MFEGSKADPYAVPMTDRRVAVLRDLLVRPARLFRSLDAPGKKISDMLGHRMNSFDFDVFREFGFVSIDERDLVRITETGRTFLKNGFMAGSASEAERAKRLLPEIKPNTRNVLLALGRGEKPHMHNMVRYTLKKHGILAEAREIVLTVFGRRVINVLMREERAKEKTRAPREVAQRNAAQLRHEARAAAAREERRQRAAERPADPEWGTWA